MQACSSSRLRGEVLSKEHHSPAKHNQIYVQETKTETKDINITCKQDPVDNHAVLSYTGMDGSEHERVTICEK
jgi:hypothetical protein